MGSNLIGSFQTRVNPYNPLAVEGDFASSNPRASAVTSAGGFVAGPNGVLIGNFAWLSTDGVTLTNSAQGAVQPIGFIHRDQQGLLTQYLQAAGTLIPAGFAVTAMNEGDFFDLIAGGTDAVPGSACYARYSDGALFIGSAPTGATGTGSVGATFTASAGSPNTELVVTAVTGLISIGDTVSGTGITAGTTIVSQVSGTTGGAGTYTLSAANTASAATVTSFGSVLNVTAVTGVLAIGDAITGTGIPAGATLETQVSGPTGGAGVYTISVPATAYAASTALTVVAGILLTNFVAKTAANVGELVKISTWGN